MNRPSAFARASALRTFGRLYPTTQDVKIDLHPDTNHFTITDMEDQTNRADFTLGGILLSEYHDK